MSIHYLGMKLTFVGPPGSTDDEFDDFTDRLMDRLDELDCVDPDLTGSLVERTAVITMGVEADDEQDAMWRFLGVLRTALHAAECNTAEWPKFVVLEQTTQDVDLATA